MTARKEYAPQIVTSQYLLRSVLLWRSSEYLISVKTYQYESVKSMREEITTSFRLHMHCSTPALHLKRNSSLMCVLKNDFPRCSLWRRRLGNLRNFQLVEKQNSISLSDKLCERKLFFDVGWNYWSVSNGIKPMIKSRKIANILTDFKWYYWWKCEAYIQACYSARHFSNQKCEYRELLDVLLSDRKQNAWT